MAKPEGLEENLTRLRVWDLPVRVFHFLLIIAIGFLWYSGENADDLDRHMQVGQIILALLLFRLVWGVMGSTTARFMNFIRPFQVIEYLYEIKAGKPKPLAGHNPLGGLMVLSLLASLLLQAISGLYSSDEVFSDGPLYTTASEQLAGIMASIHHFNFNVLLGLLVLHIAAILYYLIAKRTNLVWPMITGVMFWPVSLARPQLAFRSAPLAATLFALIYFAADYLLSSL